MSNAMASNARKPTFGEVTLDAIVGAADDSVKVTLANGKGIGEFLAGIDGLELSEQHEIVDQAIRLHQDYYVHLPMERAMHGIDLPQRLRLLGRRLDKLRS